MAHSCAVTVRQLGPRYNVLWNCLNFGEGPWFVETTILRDFGSSRGSERIISTLAIDILSGIKVLITAFFKCDRTPQLRVGT